MSRIIWDRAGNPTHYVSDKLGIIRTRVDADPSAASQTSSSPDLIRRSPRLPVVVGMPGSGPGTTGRVSAESRCQRGLVVRRETGKE
jgi:hypothetical protein